jgi:hypothetical protein
MSEKNTPPPDPEVVQALTESILSQILEVRAQDAAEASQQNPNETADLTGDADLESEEIFSDIAEVTCFQEAVQPLLFDDVTGFMHNLDAEIYSGFISVLQENYPENTFVNETPEHLEWWSIDEMLWRDLSQIDELTIEFQWSENDAYYLWGRVPTEFPVLFDPALLRLWKENHLSYDSNSAFKVWSTTELKLIYRVLQKNIFNHVELMDSEFLSVLQTFLQQSAQDDDVDPTDHSAWSNWLNG